MDSDLIDDERGDAKRRGSRVLGWSQRWGWSMCEDEREPARGKVDVLSTKERAQNREFDRRESRGKTDWVQLLGKEKKEQVLIFFPPSFFLTFNSCLERKK